MLRSSNRKHEHKQHFCINCLQGFSLEESRDKHSEYCKNNEVVRIEMPTGKDSFVKFHDGQNHFKVPFAMYANFEAILKPIEGPSPNPDAPYTEEINQHIPSGFCVNCVFAYEEVENPLEIYRGEDCAEVFCDYVENEAKRLHHMFPKKPVKPLTSEQWREFNRASNCHICFKGFKDDNPRLEITATTMDCFEGPPIGTVI